MTFRWKKIPFQFIKITGGNVYIYIYIYMIFFIFFNTVLLLIWYLFDQLIYLYSIGYLDRYGTHFSRVFNRKMIISDMEHIFQEFNIYWNIYYYYIYTIYILYTIYIFNIYWNIKAILCIEAKIYVMMYLNSSDKCTLMLLLNHSLVV